MVSSPMFVSPRETSVMWHIWRGLVCASLFFATSLGAAALAQEPRFFRIGTAATGGSFFEVGGLVASAISSPADGPACGRGGCCGVRGLVAVAPAPPGSMENLLKGKRVSVGEQGSGTAADAAVLLAAAGLGGEKDLKRKYLRPGPAAEELKGGSIDAMFLVGGYPVPAIRELAASSPIRLVPIEGKIVDGLKKDFSFYTRTEVPAGSYFGVDSATTSLGFSALWLVNADIDADLVYAITQSLWNPATAVLLGALDPIGNRIRLDRALDGLSVPLHPGAARFYREAGKNLDSVPEAAAEPAEQKK